MKCARCGGVLLHPTSLPGPYGIGDLGAEAYRFVDFLVRARQSLWQVLPLGPTGYGDSPYASFSSHAGNPLLIDLSKLVEEGDLTEEDLTPIPDLPADRVDYGRVIPYKIGLLRRAAERFRAGEVGARRAGEVRARRVAFERFCAQKAHWLDDYALFMALKEAHDGAMWNTWELGIVQRKPEAMERWTAELADAIYVQKYVQFQFFNQWSALRQYANERSIRIIGDVPIFVAPDSADAWSNPEIFYMDEVGQLTAVAGVPPDYFSPTGQRWGNPLYRWDVIAAGGYRWWIERIQSVLELVDILRIDHFRGFEDYWEIPAQEPTAVKGRWLPGPRDAFFEGLKGALGDDLPIIAEDLGMITDEVHELRKRTGLPGMKVLHFAFTEGSEHEYLPHNYSSDCVVYLGTHDNDTTIGWFDSRGQKERDSILRYLGRDGHDIVWAMMHLALMSVADIAIVTAQDLLKLGSEARMNTPGTSNGNWQWRYRPGALHDDIARWLGELTETFGRAVEEPEELDGDPLREVRI
jgi:4-alpha-glucanotransferase